jgi:two-component system sensor histidine kinase ArlS
MKIRTKLILNYSILSIILLLFFSLIVVFAYTKYRQRDFETRLHNRAASTSNMLLNEKTIDSTLLKIIDNNIITLMGNLQITILDKNDMVIYSSKMIIDNNTNQTNWLSGIFSIGYKSITFKHNRYGHIFTIKASAIDNYGANELISLLNIIKWVLGFSIILIVGFGFYNAVWSLKPFKRVIKEVEAIEPTLVKKRVTISGNDEVSQLAIVFNTLLDRIEQAFETEKSFISNASHELRTPVTSVLGQIEVGLNKARNDDEYKEILKSVYDDTTQMANIINGFLDLAEANLVSDQLQMNPVRIDELIFAIVDDFEHRKPHYNVTIDFNSTPESDTQLECLANERLLRIMFSNLIDNACKYSGDKKAKVTIDFTQSVLIISIIDHGIGIPEEDRANIFKPLFRGRNTSGNQGHGIGLAIVSKIAELHKISLEIQSELNIGTTVKVRIKI